MSDSTAPRVGFLVLLLLLALGAAGYLVLRAGPTLRVENRLVEPVRVALGDTALLVPERSTVKYRLTGRDPLFAQWYLVQPSGPGGPLGVPMQGTLRVERPTGTVVLRITARQGDEAWFAPLITNQTGRPLGVVVNQGLQGAMDCRCGVPAGSIRTRIGYYPLFGNSTVQVRDGAGRTALFPDLGDAVDPESGVVGLRFNPGDLR